MQYGLIGERLSHSFSPGIHAQLAQYKYELKELKPSELVEFIAQRDFEGLNVTIPYKQDVIPLCDEVDERVRRIGAANTLVNRGGRLYAYNTDYDGVAYTLRRHGIALQGKTLLILGSGGTSATVRAVAKDAGAKEILVASRSGRGGALGYGQAAARTDVQVVYNCSPAGMYPHNGESLVDLARYPRLEAVLDAVYNPFKTALLLQAEALGVPAVNGLEMLVAQAAYASALFGETKTPAERIEQIHRDMLRRMVNLSLVGMPGCGKTSLGKTLAKELDKQFVDLDEEIEKRAGMPIPEIFATHGEAWFRGLESEITAEFGAHTGQVLSTGGGIVKNAANVQALKQNGPVVFIDCPVERLSLGKGRPLAQSRQDLDRLYAERHGLYLAAADVCMEYHPYFRENTARLQAAFDAALTGEWGGAGKRPPGRPWQIKNT